MSNLVFLERTLGSLNSWPQDIPRYLFLVTPTPYTTLELAAFFFGTRIPLITALDFFHECCNPPSEILDSCAQNMTVGDDVPTLKTCTNTMTCV